MRLRAFTAIFTRLANDTTVANRVTDVLLRFSFFRSLLLLLTSWSLDSWVLSARI